VVGCEADFVNGLRQFSKFVKLPMATLEILTSFTRCIFAFITGSTCSCDSKSPFPTDKSSRSISCSYVFFSSGKPVMGSAMVD